MSERVEERKRGRDICNAVNLNHTGKKNEKKGKEGEKRKSGEED